MKNYSTKAGLLSALILVSVSAFGVAGCTPSAREDVSNAGSDLGSATKKSADATKDVVASAGQSVEKGAVDAGKDIKKSADTAAKDAGASIDKGTQTLTLTPKVKAAILADDSVKATDLNIDTHSDTKQVVINGTVATAAMKAAAMADAKKAMADDKSGYTLVNNLKVAK